ncbi:hypothetical protein KGM_209492 [Danaus plexippus plexippus]|uniref:Uncharacterized protein n=1 Tax=Danaus plexippus plexippus TaxID=278856 RepID=A0A212EY60_DANPL|nr:hypothetical protein KGM_209492 [Danaus plexippus plexippus]
MKVDFKCTSSIIKASSFMFQLPPCRTSFILLCLAIMLDLTRYEVKKQELTKYFNEM